MKKVSVIVPVYQVEKYLRRCIDSICAQTYKNLEIILVDDGSTDGSGEICDKYENIDDRIIVIHQKNQGLSEARNTGLECATGEYIAFVDSDDLIREDMYEILLRELVNTDSDFIKSDFQGISNENKVERVKREYSVNCFSTEDAINDFLYTEFSPNKSMKSTIWDGLYKRAIFFEEDRLMVRFPKDKINEDTYIFSDIIYRAKKIAHVDATLYFYFNREDSITKSRLTVREINSIDLWDHIDHVIFLNTGKHEDICAYNSATRYIRTLNKIYASNLKKKYFLKVQKQLVENREKYLSHINDQSIRITLKLIKRYWLYRAAKKILRSRLY